MWVWAIIWMTFLKIKLRSPAINIKDALVLRFVLIFGVLWVLASFSIYYSSAQFRHDEFYQRLHTRASTAAKLLIEVEEVDASLLRKIEDANPIKLPGERITIYDYNNVEIFSTDTQDSIRMDEERFNDIRLEGEYRWRQGSVEVLGLLYIDQYERFVVVAAGQDVYGFRKLDNLRNILITVFFISLIVIAMAARLYAGNALRPISEVVEEVNQIGISNLGKRVSEGNGKDEIATLGITFNRMLDRLQSAFESQKSFITNASHELRTPMTSVLSQVDVALLKDRDAKHYKGTLQSVRDDIQELSALAGKLLLLARVDAFRETFEPIRVDSILWQAISEVSRHFKNNILVDFSSDIDDEQFFTIMGNEQLIRSVLQNLLENACKYSKGKDVRVLVELAAEGLCLKVEDQGVGIAPEDLPEIGQPFYRGKNTSGFSGSGIGLNLSKKIVELHHGTFSLDSRMGEGTRVSIVFEYLGF